MNRGTKPKPAILRLVTGNAGHRPINESEPQPSGEVKRPSFLKGRGKKLWLDLAPDLIAKGILKSWDVPLFSMWCFEMGLYQENPKSTNAAGRTALARLGEQYGLTPPGRARLKGNVEENKDPAEKYF